MSALELKNLIISIIKKYDLEYHIQNAPKYQPLETIMEFGYESRKRKNIINIANLCLKEQKIIDHITYMINTNNVDILNKFYSDFIKVEITNDIYNDNQLSIKLYPFMIYFYTQIFRDVALNNDVLKWCKDILKKSD